MEIDIVQNKQKNYHIYLENMLKESGRIISYEFINLILIVFIDTTKLIKLLMIQPSCQYPRREAVICLEY